MTASLGFGPDARLKSGEQFRRVFEQGRKCVGASLIVWYRIGAVDQAPKLGLSVSAKVGGAVKRARYKRFLRESFRLRRTELPRGLEIVAYPRPGCRWEGKSDAEHDLFTLLNRSAIIEK